MRYVLKIHNRYVRFEMRLVAGKETPSILLVPLVDATVLSQEQIQTIGQDVYEYAKEVHNTLVEVIIVL